MAVGEKLCRLSGTESTEHLARVRSGDSQEPAASERRWDDAPEEYIAILADMVGSQTIPVMHGSWSYIRNAKTHKVKVGYSLTSAAQTKMMMLHNITN